MRVKTLLGMLLVTGVLFASASVVCAQTKGRTGTRRQAPAKPKLSPQANAEHQEAAKRGDEARLAGRLNEAVEHYISALKIRPDWVEGWWHVGTILYDGDHYEAARDAFRNLTALDSKKGPAWALLGLCEFQTREYERAVVSMQRGRSLGLAGNVELENVVRYHAALVYIRFEQFEIAFEILREFLQSGNESSKVIEAFGLTMLRMPFLPNEIPPDKREQVLIAGRAGFNMAARRKDEARGAFDELLARYPDAPNVHYGFGVYLLNHDADAALKEFNRELEISPSHVPAMLQLAFEYLKRAEHEAALPWAEKAVQFAPKMYPGRNVLGRVLIELGQVERAIKELEEGVRLAPDSPEMHYALARAYTRAGRRQDAAREREIFQRLEKLYNAKRPGAPAEDGTDNPPKAKP
ncbi:MAG: tetratricopeptide repeat protein [Blastocatellia bacterium]